MEYVVLTRDTTEADLKQRREIRGGASKTAVYENQGVVLAALHGRILVIEGIEKVGPWFVRVSVCASRADALLSPAVHCAF